LRSAASPRIPPKARGGPGRDKTSSRQCPCLRRCARRSSGLSLRTTSSGRFRSGYAIARIPTHWRCAARARTGSIAIEARRRTASGRHGGCGAAERTSRRARRAASDQSDRRGRRHHALSRTRRAGDAAPRCVAPGVVCRSSNSRLYRAIRERLGLYRADRGAGLRLIGRRGRAAIARPAAARSGNRPRRDSGDDLARPNSGGASCA